MAGSGEQDSASTVKFRRSTLFIYRKTSCASAELSSGCVNFSPSHLKTDWIMLRSQADVALTPADGRSRGFGVVLFSRYEDAMKAIEVYHGFSWQTRILDVRIDSQDPRGEFALAEANRQTAMQQQAERYQLAMQQHQQQYGHLNNLGGGQPAGLIPPPPPPPLPLPMPGSASSSESPQLRTGDGPGSSPSPRLETVGSPRFMNGASTSSPAPSPRPSPAASASTPPSSTDEASLGPKAQRQDSASPIITLIQPPPPPPPPPPPSIFAAGPQGTMHGGLMQYYQQQQQHQQMRPGMAPGAGSNPNFGPSPVPAQYVGRHLFVGNVSGFCAQLRVSGADACFICRSCRSTASGRN